MYEDLVVDPRDEIRLKLAALMRRGVVLDYRDAMAIDAEVRAMEAPYVQKVLKDLYKAYAERIGYVVLPYSRREGYHLVGSFKLVLLRTVMTRLLSTATGEGDYLVSVAGGPAVRVEAASFLEAAHKVHTGSEPIYVAALDHGHMSSVPMHIIREDLDIEVHERPSPDLLSP